MKLFITITLVFLLTFELSFSKLELNNIFPPQVSTQLRDIKFIDKDFGIAIGFTVYSQTEYEGVVGITTDGGKNWDISIHENILFFGVDILDKNTFHLVGFYMLTNQGIIKSSTDQGASWDTKICDGTEAPLCTSLYAINYLDSQTLISGGYDGSIMKSTNAGQSWAMVSQLEEGYSIWNIRESKNSLFATHVRFINDSWDYKIHKSTDNGDCWTQHYPTLPDGFNISAIEVTQDGNMYAFGDKAGYYSIALSEDNGDHWVEEYTSSNPGSFGCGYVDNSGLVMAGGDNGGLAYKMGNNPWQEESLEEEYNIWKIQGVGDKIMMTTAMGKVLEYNKSGTSVDQKDKSDILITPNPAGNYLQILGIELSQNYTLKIHSLGGSETSLNLEGNKVDISGLTQGIYLYTLFENDLPSFTGKFIKY